MKGSPGLCLSQVSIPRERVDELNGPKGVGVPPVI